MMKYDVRFCECGRIHMIPVEKVETAVTQNKNLLHICGSCGRGTIIGADIENGYNDPSDVVYNMYSYPFDKSDRSITIGDFTDCTYHKPFSEIFYTKGIPVPMNTGEYARSFYYDTFCDMWYPDFLPVQRTNVTLDEMKKFIDDFKKNQITVNMKRFIIETPDEYLDDISKYLIRAFDWTGTKWDRNLIGKDTINNE